MALHPVVRRGLQSYAATYALMYLTFTMIAGPGPTAFVTLSGDASNAGLYFAMFALVSAAGSFTGGRLMDKRGRRPALVGGMVAIAAGFVGQGLGVQQGSFPLFALGLATAAFGFGVGYLARLAAADLFPPSLRGRGVGWVLVGATVGAVVGPLLLIASEPLAILLGQSSRVLVWFLGPPFLILAAIIVTRAPEPLTIARNLAPYHPDVPLTVHAPPPVRAARRYVAAATVATALAAGTMVAVMGVAGPAVTMAGHGTGILGATMAAHFVGMFGLAPVVGRLSDRIGRRVTILTGLAVIAAGGLAVATLPGAAGFAAGLFLVGLGWSFAFLGASVLLADVAPLAERARTIARADLLGAFAQAGLAAGAGVVFATRGLAGVGILAAALVLLPFLVVAMLPDPRRAAPPAPA